jgi:PAS domain S-box-containing protein
MTPTSISYRRLRTVLVGAYLALCIVIVVFATLYLRAEYQRLEAAAYARTGTLARALEEHVVRTFALIDIQLRDLGQHLVERGALDRPTTPEVVKMLREAVARIGIVISIYVDDAEGRGHTTSIGTDIRHLRVASFEHTRNAFESSADKLFFGRVTPGSVTGQVNLPVARRIVDRNQRLAGVIGTAIQPGYFAEFYKSLQAGDGTSLRLIRGDGVVLARFPDRPDLPLDVSKLKFFRERVLKEAAGSQEVESEFDGRTRVFSFRHVPGFDLIVAVSEDHASRFEPWWRATATTATVILLFLVILLALLIFSLRELKQHAEAEERYALVVRGTNAGIWDWRPAARQGYLSRRWGEILGYEEGELSVVKDPLLHSVHPDDKARVTEAIDRQLGRGDSFRVELRLRHKDGRYRWVRARGTALRDASGAVARMTGAMTDITERRRAEEALRASEEQLRRVLDNVDEVIYAVDLDPQDPLRGKVQFVSSRVTQIVGYEPDEFLADGNLWISLICPEDLESLQRQTGAMIASGERATREYRVRNRASGEYRWMEDRVLPRKDASGKVVGYFGVARDVTVRKNAEVALLSNATRIRDLLKRLVEAQEAERRRFASDLHDLIGQNLSAVGIELERLRGTLSPDCMPASAAVLDELGDLVAKTMSAVRQAITDLRPALLDDYGLVAAIQSHAKSVEHWSGLAVSVEGDTLKPRPAPAAELALFRIAQEALMNSAKHSGASRVSLVLSNTAGAVRLCVEDNGRGIASAAAGADPKGGWGIAFMRERAEALGGTLSIEDTGAGTRVVAEIPHGHPDTAG